MEEEAAPIAEDHIAEDHIDEDHTTACDVRLYMSIFFCG